MGIKTKEKIEQMNKIKQLTLFYYTFFIVKWGNSNCLFKKATLSKSLLDILKSANQSFLLKINFNFSFT